MNFPTVIFGYTREDGREVIALAPEELVALEVPNGAVVGTYEKTGEATLHHGPTLLGGVMAATAPKPKKGRPRGSRNKPKAEAPAAIAIATTSTPEPAAYRGPEWRTADEIAAGVPFSKDAA